MKKAFAFLTGPFLVLLALSGAEIKPGSDKARWPIKTSIPASIDLTKPGTLLPLADFLALPPAADHMSTAYERVLFPKPPGAKLGDGDYVRTRGYIRLIAGEPDGDYHMQITERPDTFENCLVVEVPDNEPDFVSNKAVAAAAETVRSFVMRRLTKSDPTGRIIRIVHPTYVEITGQLFFDAEHQAGMAKGIYRGKSIQGKRLPSKTSWEIHPVTKMVFAPVPASH